jgi:hypothetical protein
MNVRFTPTQRDGLEALAYRGSAFDTRRRGKVVKGGDLWNTTV